MTASLRTSRWAAKQLDLGYRAAGLFGATAATSNHLRVRATAGRIDPARVDAVLDLVGLADAADQRVGGFSLGMRQRLGLAAALTLLVTIVASGEFRHQTATDTYLDQPDRVRVLTAKLIAGTAAGAMFGLVAAALATGVGLGFVAAKGYDVALATGTIAGFAAGAALASGLMAAVGVAIGSLLRSQIAPSSPCSPGASGSSRSPAGCPVRSPRTCR